MDLHFSSLFTTFISIRCRLSPFISSFSSFLLPPFPFLHLNCFCSVYQPIKVIRWNVTTVPFSTPYTIRLTINRIRYIYFLIKKTLISFFFFRIFFSSVEWMHFFYDLCFCPYSYLGRFTSSVRTNRKFYINIMWTLYTVCVRLCTSHTETGIYYGERKWTKKKIIRKCLQTTIK